MADINLYREACSKLILLCRDYGVTLEKGEVWESCAPKILLVMEKMQAQIKDWEGEHE